MNKIVSAYSLPHAALLWARSKIQSNHWTDSQCLLCSLDHTYALASWRGSLVVQCGLFSMDQILAVSLRQNSH